MTDTLLPDVSEFQTGASAPDWAGIKKQNGGAGICRVGYGLHHLDHMFVSNYTALKTNKYSFIGLYHYLVGSQDAAAQAAQFCSWIGPPSAVAPGTVFIADLEEGAGNQRSRAEAWLGFVDRFYGLDSRPLPERSWLYSGASFAAEHGLAPVFSSPRRTWVAAYSAAEPRLGHTLWQSTDGKTGSHITAWAGCGRTDTSLYHGPLAGLAAMGWKTPGGHGGAARPGDRFHGEYVTAGQLSLAGLAAKLQVPPSTLLRMTAVRFGTFGDPLAAYLNAIHSGTKPADTPLPAGIRFWVD
jgi:hypothetical protein